MKSGGWQAGDEGLILATFTDPVSKAPIDWTNTEATVTVKPPGEDQEEVALPSATEDGGKVSAPILFESAGVYTGHVVLSGERKKKIAWKVEVKDD